MLHFLELPKVDPTDDFNKNYNMYYYFFSLEAVQMVENLCEKMCDPWLYGELNRYFVDAQDSDLRVNPNTVN